VKETINEVLHLLELSDPKNKQLDEKSMDMDADDPNS
jgi:hypothetical protein